MRRKVLAWIGAAAAALCTLSSPAYAVELIVNGDFELFTYNNGGAAAMNASFPAFFDGSYGVGDGVAGTQYSPNPSNDSIPWGKNLLTGWDVSGYNFMYAPGHADTTGAWNGFGPVFIAGPNSSAPVPASNTMPANSPAGGYYLGSDGASEDGINFAGTISQTITGLTVNERYTVTFWWAAGQQDGPQYDGPTTESWNVSFSGLTGMGDAWSESQSTATWSNPARGFKPWSQEAFTFTAQSSTATLSFLAQGTPDGQPPFSLLDGVSVQAYVPEPQTWAMMMIGFALVGGVMRTRRKPISERRLLNSQII